MYICKPQRTPPARDAQACQSEAGAASISAIMQCVQASQAPHTYIYIYIYIYPPRLPTRTRALALQLLALLYPPCATAYPCIQWCPPRYDIAHYYAR